MLCNSVTLKGTKYSPGKNNLLHIGYDPFGLPEFGSLVKIWFVLDVGVFFVTKVMESVAFRQELNAIEIEDASLPQTTFLFSKSITATNLAKKCTYHSDSIYLTIYRILG